MSDRRRQSTRVAICTLESGRLSPRQPYSRRRGRRNKLHRWLERTAAPHPLSGHCCALHRAQADDVRDGRPTPRSSSERNRGIGPELQWERSRAMFDRPETFWRRLHSRS